MNKEGWRRTAEILAELASLAIREGDFGKADMYLKDAVLALEKMRAFP